VSLELELREKFRFYEISQQEKKIILCKLKEVLKSRSEILVAVLYGSFLRKYPFRDIDLALYVKPQEDLLKYKFMLEKELSEEIGFPVDVKILNYAPAWFILEVFESGKVLLNRFGLLEKIYLKALDEVKYFEQL